MSEGPFVLPKLLYAYDALEPHIDAKTMEIHHTKHHQAYITNLNKAIVDFKIKETELEDVLAKHSDKAAVRNHGGGHYNHLFFWHIITPGGAKEPTGPLAKALVDQFGSIDQFKEEFTKASTTRFGSGWAWLVLTEEGKLKILSTANQDVPFLSATGGIDKATPLLGLDVWEHAYYLKYQNRRADYINAFYNVINWSIAGEIYIRIT